MTIHKSTFAAHLLETDHRYENNNEKFCILEFVNEWDKMITNEELHIFLDFKIDPSNILKWQKIKLRNLNFEKILKSMTNRKYNTLF